MMLDKGLKQQVISHDRTAQLKLYRLCYPILFGVANLLEKTKEEELEFVNGTFIEILKNLKSYNEEHNFFDWLKIFIKDYIKWK